MHVLLLGYSSIAQRRIIPALSSMDEVQRLDIACHRRNITIQSPVAGDIYHDYAEALAKSQANIVYVSLVNSLHRQWVETALHAGYHVVVDKPAFVNIDDARAMVALASSKKRTLIEAVVFAYHPQIAAIKALLEKYIELNMPMEKYKEFYLIRRRPRKSGKPLKGVYAK